MTALVRIVDEHLGGRGRDPAFTLRLASERITARELIGRRVSEEVVIANRRRAELHADHDRARSFLIRFEPGSVEARLNGPPRSKRSRPDRLDEDEEVTAAIAAFEANKFILLIDDRQVEGLDQPVTLTSDSEVVFLRLAPLVGG